MARALLVASSGGHIDQLFSLVPRVAGLGAERLWVTCETAQTSSLLEDEPTEWVGRIGQRDAFRALSRIPDAVALLRRYRPDVVISTGAALGVPYLLAASLLGVEAHYVESATRRDGPSLSGRILAKTPRVTLHEQSFSTVHPRWHHVGSVFDTFVRAPRRGGTPSRVVVILGSEKFPFPRALKQVRTAFGPDAMLTVQCGSTPVPTGTDYRSWMPYEELRGAVESADLVVTHAGVGAVLSALRAGHHPIVLPRRAKLGEHVDDHQNQLAQLLRQRGLATVLEPEESMSAALGEAMPWSTVRVDPAPIDLLATA